MRWVLLLALVASRAHAAALGDPLAYVDRLAQAARIEVGPVRASLGALADLEGYWYSGDPPGLLFGGRRDGFVNPRFSLFLDVNAGERWYAMVQMRVDRGFDPRVADGIDARADEYLVRWRPFGTAALQLQVGKFATVAGGWVPRHLSWDNPFVTPPQPYDRVTVAADATGTTTRGGLLARKALVDRKRAWVPIIWGPSYATGAAAFGTAGRFDWALEIKNASLASRPLDWDSENRGFDAPTVSGRLGVRPTAAWRLGVSGSIGPYLREGVYVDASPGREDFRQTLIGADASWAWRSVQVWSEVFFNRFDLPIGPGRVAADALAYYLEARWKFAPGAWLAARWNQQLFDDLPGTHPATSWERDAWRLDGAVGWRPFSRLQVKVQYSLGREVAPHRDHDHEIATQMTLRF